MDQFNCQFITALHGLIAFPTALQTKYHSMPGHKGLRDLLRDTVKAGCQIIHHTSQKHGI